MSVSLMSLPFLALAGASTVALAAFRGRLRSIAFLLLNLAFLGGLLLGGRGLVAALLFCFLGYGIIHLIRARPSWGLRTGLPLLVLVFVYLRRYDFLERVLPEGALIETLATVGLSFMFFKIVHVMIEVASGTLAAPPPLVFFNYTLGFHTYMMGPIQRFQDFHDQWSGAEEAIPSAFEAHLDATLRVLTGLVKAYVIADFLLPYTLSDALDIHATSDLDLLAGMFAFYFYLYLNFSGYCDVVIGLGGLMGVRPPENFDRPWLARNISDFWFRFHRSLTLWLTDYVFSPAYKWALSRPMTARWPLLSMNAALMLTMIVSGLWHGTTLSFLLFGLAHGLYFVVFRTAEAVSIRWFGRKAVTRFRALAAVRMASVLLTLTAVATSFLFFRLEAELALDVMGRLLGT